MLWLMCPKEVYPAMWLLSGDSISVNSVMMGEGKSLVMVSVEMSGNIME